jgi:NAD+ diphosphatase
MFAGNPLDRAAERRCDPAWLEEAQRRDDALVLCLSGGRPLLQADADGGLSIAYLPARVVDGAAPTFLGLWKSTPVFAAEWDAASMELGGVGEFHDLREAALGLPAAEAGLCATAKALFEWRSRRGFCSVCGARNAPADGGWKQVCTACAAEHFPRTDPVVIMLAVHDGRCLLGRQERWPRRMFSALAGFVEPGETIEEACARELREEAGLNATSVRYHSSQPWPFPSSLMIGLIAEVDGDAVTPDPVELHDHHWLTKDEARAMLAGDHPDIRAISPVAIARTLVEGWVAEDR